MASKSTSRRSSPPRRTVQTKRAQPNLQRAPMDRGTPNPAAMQQRLGNSGTQAWLTEQAGGQAIQAKLTVGEPGDMYEKEADAAASRIVAGQPVERVSRLPSGGLSRAMNQLPEREEPVQQLEEEGEEESFGVQALPVQAKCIECEKEGNAQRRESPQASSANKTDTTTAESAMAQSGVGSPLNSTLQAQMEEGFGTDFSGVGVHTGSAANEAAQALNARAFTRGSDVYLAHGESSTDVQLMGHELTHTLQQSPNDINRKGENVPGSQAVYDFAQLIVNGAFSGSEFAEALATEDFTSLQLRDLKERVLDMQTTSDLLIDAALEEIDNVLAGRTDLKKVQFVPTPCEPGDSVSVNANAWTTNERLIGIAEGTEAPLKKGGQGEAVKLVQQALLQWGCELSDDSVNLLPKFRDDGDFGFEMKLGVKEFQKRNGLSSDGAVGFDTLFNLQEKVVLQSMLNEESAVQELMDEEEKEDKAKQEALEAVGDIESRWQEIRTAKQKGLAPWITHGDQVVKLIRQHTEGALVASAASESSKFAAYQHVLKTDLIAYQFISWHTVVFANLIALEPQLKGLIDSFDADSRTFTGRAENEALVRELYMLTQVFPGQAATALKLVGTENTITVKVGSYSISFTGTTASDPKVAGIFEKEIASLSDVQGAIQVGILEINVFLSTARAEGLVQAGDAIIQFLLTRGGKGKGKGRGPKPKGKKPPKKSDNKGKKKDKKKGNDSKGKKKDKKKGKKGKWGCQDVRCNVYPDPSKKPPKTDCPIRVIGETPYIHPSYSVACKAAQVVANLKVPRYCIKRHCNCETKCTQK